jgi:hypothetical protein
MGAVAASRCSTSLGLIYTRSLIEPLRLSLIQNSCFFCLRSLQCWPATSAQLHLAYTEQDVCCFGCEGVSDPDLIMMIHGSAARQQQTAHKHYGCVCEQISSHNKGIERTENRPARSRYRLASSCTQTPSVRHCRQAAARQLQSPAYCSMEDSSLQVQFCCARHLTCDSQMYLTCQSWIDELLLRTLKVRPGIAQQAVLCRLRVSPKTQLRSREASQSTFYTSVRFVGPPVRYTATKEAHAVAHVANALEDTCCLSCDTPKMHKFPVLADTASASSW